MTEKEARKKIDEFEKHIGLNSVPAVRNDVKIAEMITLLNVLVPKPKTKEEKKAEKKAAKKDKPK